MNYGSQNDLETSPTYPQLSACLPACLPPSLPPSLPTYILSNTTRIFFKFISSTIVVCPSLESFVLVRFI